MTLLRTDAVVLHAFDYLESSRILRLMTRDAGVQSVIARGARRSRARFATALDVFASGTACVSARPGRDLQTLTSFDISRSRPELATDLSRLAGAAMLAELVLRTASSDAAPELFDVLVEAFDGLASTTVSDAPAMGLGGAWRIIATLGFSPSLDACVECEAVLSPEHPAGFSARAGGALCQRCSRRAPGSRTLPGSARDALRSWLVGEPLSGISGPTLRAHQRLLREYVREHVNPTGPTNAYDLWEKAGALVGDV